MCVKFYGKWKRVEKSFYVYKAVHHFYHFQHSNGRYSSAYDPYDRATQRGCMSNGEKLFYEIGKTTKSSIKTTPGLYCYTRYNVERSCVAYRFTILRCRVPKGAYARKTNVGFNVNMLIPERVLEI